MKHQNPHGVRLSGFFTELDNFRGFRMPDEVARVAGQDQAATLQPQLVGSQPSAETASSHCVDLVALYTAAQAVRDKVTELANTLDQDIDDMGVAVSVLLDTSFELSEIADLTNSVAGELGWLVAAQSKSALSGTTEVAA